MANQFSRTSRLFGIDGIKILQASHVAVFGLGGVGGYVVEALTRAGVGALDLIDNDTVSLTNLNRQIYALHSTLDAYKTEVAKQRCLDINPNVKIRIFTTFYLPETAEQFDFSQYDYIVDAIDTISGKISLVEQAEKYHIPVISAMGAGNKLDPTAFEIADIYQTEVCPLAKVMRRELKKRGVLSLKVVYSKEKPQITEEGEEEAEEKGNTKRLAPGSVSFVPSVVGLIMAGEVVKDLINKR